MKNLSYCNLPGMILGVAVPRMNLTIFATKVELQEPRPEKLIPLPQRKKQPMPRLMKRSKKR